MGRAPATRASVEPCRKGEPAQREGNPAIPGCPPWLAPMDVSRQVGAVDGGLPPDDIAGGSRRHYSLARRRRRAGVGGLVEARERTVVGNPRMRTGGTTWARVRFSVRLSRVYCFGHGRTRGAGGRAKGANGSEFPLFRIRLPRGAKFPNQLLPSGDYKGTRKAASSVYGDRSYVCLGRDVRGCFGRIWRGGRYR